MPISFAAHRCRAGLTGLILSLLAAGVANSAITPLVNHADTWRFRKGTNAPQLNWKTVADASLDATWSSGPGGFGYASNEPELALVGTRLTDMLNRYTTVYTRRTFTASGIDTNDHLLLTVDWDDGFIAWLDGVHLTNAVIANPPAEPAFNARATTDHESSNGGSGAQPAQTYDFGPIGDRLGAGNHILAVMGLNDSTNSSDCILIVDLVAAPPPPPPTNIVWTLANSPYVVSNNLVIPSSANLIIEPGVTVLFNQGATLTINGQLIAEGTSDQRIVFTRNTGATSWNRIDFTPSPRESRISYADIRFATGAGNIRANGARLYLDNIVFSDTNVQLVDVSNTSVIIRNSFFPGIGTSESLHFSTMPATGYALIEGNTFEAPRGYNDVIDFTGGNRPGPIVQFLNNVFLAGVDDCFDMDGTDAHIEGNIFMNVKQDGERDSSSNAISTGSGSGDSELVIVRNIFYNCDHALLLKDAGSAIFHNNTVVGITPNSFASQAPAFINFGEPNRGVPGGSGALLDGNIVWDLNGPAFLNFTSAVMFLTVNRSIIQNTNHPGVGNSSSDPMFVNWQTGVTAANIRSNLSLQAGSPAIGTGPNGLDMGAIVPAGASISGEPSSPTTNKSATLTVGGPGIYAYRWKLNDGPWSAEVPLTNTFLIAPTMFNNAQPIVLSNLADGSYTVYVIGKNSAGAWQSTNSPTVSKTWMVDDGDRDDDGMPNDWEEAHQLDPDDPSDGYADPDRDGLVNIREYVAGTDPQDPSSVLKIISSNVATGSFTIEFTAVAGKTYTVQRRDSLTEGVWEKVADVGAQSMTGPVQVQDTNTVSSATRYYRLATPQQ